MTLEEKIKLILEGKDPKELDNTAVQAGVENPAIVPQIDPATGDASNANDIAAGIAPEAEEPAVSLTNPLSVDPIDPTTIETDSIKEDLENIVEGMKLVSKHEPEGSVHTAKVYKDSDWDEYRVKYFKNGKHIGEDSDYHTDDLDDAKSTADSEIGYMNKHVQESIEESYVVRHGKVSAEAVRRMAKEMFPGEKTLTPEHFEKAKQHILNNVSKHKHMNEWIESVPELLATDANLTEEYKAKAKELFESEVEKRVAERVAQIQEESEKKIASLEEDLQKQKEEFISEMSEKIDLYLEDVSDKWMVENRTAIEVKAKSDIMESFMLGVKSLYEQHNMQVPESKVDIVAEMQEKLTAIQAQLEVQETKLIEANDMISDLTKDKIISESVEGMTKIDKVRFEKLIEDVEFTCESEFKGKLENIREQYFAKREQVAQNLTEDRLDMSTQAIIESATSKTISPNMQAYLRVLTGKK
jgi:hypothetical protein